MDSTPIYTELQQKLIDPEEETNWGPSAPPEFAEELTENADAQDDNGKRKNGGRSGGRRHRAES